MFHSFNLHYQLEQVAFESAQQQASQASSQINETFGGVRQIADAIAVPAVRVKLLCVIVSCRDGLSAA